MLHYRVVEERDFAEIDKIYAAEGIVPPTQQFKSGVVATTEAGRIVGYWGFTLLPHAGPLWIHPEYRGMGMWRKLNSALDKELNGGPGTGYYCLTDSPKTEHIFEEVGMKPSGYKVYRKTF